MRRLMLAALVTAPVVAHAANGRKAANFQESVNLAVSISEVNGEVKACGLRPDAWVHTVGKNIFLNIYSVAGNLWGKKGISLSPHGELEFQSATRDIGAAYAEGLHAGPQACAELIESKTMSAIDKAIGWTGGS